MTSFELDNLCQQTGSLQVWEDFSIIKVLSLQNISVKTLPWHKNYRLFAIGLTHYISLIPPMWIKFGNFEGQMCIDTCLEGIKVLIVCRTEELLLEHESLFRETTAPIKILSRKGQVMSSSSLTPTIYQNP